MAATKDGAVVAAHRFGLGARPGEVDAIGSDAAGWLEAQCVRRGAPAELASFESTEALLTRLLPAMDESREAMRDELRDVYVAEMSARYALAATTDAPFAERWVRFWANHFCVSVAGKKDLLPIVGAYEREAIRPRAFGSFEELLVSAVTHPAMLVYLDNVRSIGPRSQVGSRSGRGLNENLAREILELHTLGVHGGYTQADVTAFARMITGWTVDREVGRFTFDARRHEPGVFEWLGDSYAAGGQQDGLLALAALARHPSTAEHLATKLARHFVADDPPARAVDALARAFLTSRGDLAAVARAVIALPEAWEGERKLRTPDELVIATARALGYTDGVPMLKSAKDLGQAPSSAPSPQGWPDTAAAWSGPEAVLTRVEWAQQVAKASAGRAPDVPGLAASLFGSRLSAATAAAVRRDDPERALALLLASPELQRR